MYIGEAAAREVHLHCEQLLRVAVIAVYVIYVILLFSSFVVSSF